MDKKKDNTIEYFVYVFLIVLVIFIRTFIVTPVRVNGTSMYPTLKITYRFNNIKRFDIVVINTQDDKIIKRVIGLPGETLKFENNVLYINGQEVKETFLKEETEDFDIRNLSYDKIPSDCYFVMGDNRDNSKDSRMIGCVKKKQITGKANLVIFPLKDKGRRN